MGCVLEKFSQITFSRVEGLIFYVGLSGCVTRFMGARRHGQGGDLPISGDVVKCFVHCKTLSRRIIYALFSQPVVGFWRLRPQTPTAAPSLICPPGKNPALMSGLLCSITSFHVYRLWFVPPWLTHRQTAFDRSYTNSSASWAKMSASTWWQQAL